MVRAGTFQRAVARNRAEILRLDAESTGALLDELLLSWERVAQAGAALERYLAGYLGEVSEVELFRTGRYLILEGQLRDEVNRLAQLTGRSVDLTAYDAASMGARSASELTLLAAAEATAAGWTNLNEAAIRNLVAAFSEGSPLPARLAGYGDDAVALFRRELVQGLAEGKNPRTVERALRRVLNTDPAQPLGGVSRRLLTISRTETLRAYRAGQQETYQENRDVLDGWMWIADPSERTCEACLGLDGQVFPLTVTFQPSHVNCRCTSVGYSRDMDIPRQSGADWLARQDAATQDRVLGPRAGEAYRNGEVELRDFAKVQSSPEWGDSYVAGSLAYAREQAAARADE